MLTQILNPKNRRSENMPGLAPRVCSLVRVAAPLLVGVLAIVQAGSAVPSVITTYNFVGTCSDCTGTGTGTLVLQNYTLGNAISSSNFVSFTYTSNLTSFTIPASNLSTIVATLPSALPAEANVFFETNVSPFYVFISENANDNGDWCTGTDCDGDFGINGTWSLAVAAPTGAPAPNTIALMGVALVAVLMAQILLRRRRNQTAAR
jgi:hypothetical protein